MPNGGRESSDGSSRAQDASEAASALTPGDVDAHGGPPSVVRSSTVLAIATISARGAAFLTAIVLARGFEPSVFAVILLGQAVAQYLAMILDFGLTLGGIRLVARSPEAVRPAMGSVLVLRTVLGLTGVLLVSIGTTALELDGTARSVFVVFAIAAAIGALDLSWVRQARQSTALRGLVLAGASFLGLLVLIAAMSVSTDPVVAPLAQLVGMAAFVGLAFVVVIRREGTPQLPPRRLFTSMVFAAFPIGLATLLAQVYYNLDLLLLGVLRTLEEVAVYGALYKIVLALLMLGWTYALAVLPRLTIAAAGGPEVLQVELGVRLRHLAALLIPLLVGCAVLAEPLLITVFGSTYASGAAPFAVLLVSVPISAFGSLLLYTLVAVGRNWALPIASGCGAALNLILNLALIPPFGTMGAAWATIASVLLVLLLAAYQSRRFLPRMAWGTLWRLMVANLVVALVASIGTGWPLVLVGLAGALAYVATTAMVGFWRADELALMLSLPSRALRWRFPRAG